MPFAPSLIDKFLPGLGPNNQYVVGMTNLGYSVHNVTLAINTTRTDAQLIASPPNTSSAVAVGPVVHSLGVPPALVIAQPVGQSTGPVSYVLVTADNSAVYLAAYGNSVGAGGGGAGVSTRVFVIR